MIAKWLYALFISVFFGACVNRYYFDPTVDKHIIKTDYWPSFLLFAGARREHRLVSPLLQTNNKDSCAAAVLLIGKLQMQP